MSIEVAGAALRTIVCACGVPADQAAEFHKRSACHDCPHHRRRACGWCRTVERMLAGIEARLHVETMYGPFVMTRWEK